MTSPVPATGYATVADYETRTGLDVPPEREDAIQIRLNDNSALLDLYMGSCAAAVAAKWDDLLTSLVVARTNRQLQVPTGLSSASVGSTSITYAKESAIGAWLGVEETEILDRLIADCCPDAGTFASVGEVGVGWGGPTAEEDPDILWVLAGPPRRNQ